MNRRGMLKRIGAATAGTSALAAGAASGEEPREVEIDGEQYLVYQDPETVSPEDLTSSDVCTCDYCDPWLCNICGPC